MRTAENRPMPRDMGRFVGIYMQGLGVISISFNFLSYYVLGGWHLNGAFILFFLLAYFVKRHKRWAGFFSLCFLAFVTIVIWKSNLDLSTTFRVSMTVLLAVPALLLLTPQARKEFGVKDANE